jgi:hypothetical protein
MMGSTPPSMFYDINVPRKTEIEFINGKIVQLGIKLGIDVPHNQMLTLMLMDKEINLGLRSRQDIPKYLQEKCLKNCNTINTSDFAKKCFEGL